MTLRTYKVSLYAFLFALAVGTAWAQEQQKKSCPCENAAKQCSSCPAGCAAHQAAACKAGPCAAGVYFKSPILDPAFWVRWYDQQEKEVTTFITPIFEGGAIG